MGFTPVHDKPRIEAVMSRKCFAVSEEVGGREGIRTPDPLLAKQVLSQLSYTPILSLTY